MGKKDKKKSRFKGAYDRLTKRKVGITLGRPIGHSPKMANNAQMHYLMDRLVKEGFEVDKVDLWRPVGSSIVAQARNMIVDNFLAKDGKSQPLHDYILFIDDDQCFPEGYDPYEAVTMLLDADKDIIGAMTVRRFYPYHLNCSVWKDNGMKHISRYPKDEPFKVHQLGFGMVLIKREVIETIYHMTDPPSPIFYNPIEFNPILNRVELRGEDYRFCIHALKFRYDIWVEPRIPLRHIGDYDYGVESFEACLEEIEKTNKDMVDLCQDTTLYAELAERLPKYTPASEAAPEPLLSAAGVEEKRTETGREFVSIPAEDTTSPK